MSVKLLKGLVDRTAVLFLGVAVGTAMGYAFAGDIARVVAPDAAVAPSGPATVSGAASDAAPAGAGSAPAPGAPSRTASVAGTMVSECAMPFQPRLLRAVETGGKVRIGVFGDSFGDGLWAALYHQLPSRDAFEVIKFSQQSTGFTRYQSLNLEDHVATQIADRPVDIAVISFGANDTQGVMHKGRYAELLSPGWKQEIGARVERYVGKLRAQGAIVYWVGLPVMRKASFDADIAGMNAFFAEQMERLGVPFIETRSRSVDANGAYAAYLPDPVTGAPRLMRANDGIHMSMKGYERLTADLARRIRSYVGDARRQVERNAGRAGAGEGGGEAVREAVREAGA